MPTVHCRRGRQDYKPRITLKPVREITVRAVDNNGLPVAGAKVVDSVTELDRLNVLFAGLVTGVDGTAKLRFTEDLRLRQLVVLRSGVGLDVLAIPDAPPPGVPVPPAADSFTVTLAGASSVRIKAVDKLGQPIAGVKFAPDYLLGPARPGAGPTVAMRLAEFPAMQVATNADGIAVFDWLPRGFEQARFPCVSPEYSVVEKPESIGTGITADRLMTRDRDGPKQLTVELVLRTRVTGHVHDGEDQPVPGVAVWAMGRTLWRRAGDHRAVTNTEGKYELLLDSEKGYSLTLFGDDHRFAASHLGVIVHDGQPVENLDFKLTQGTVVRGTLTAGADHHPVVNQQIYIGQDLGPVPPEIEKAEIAAGAKFDPNNPGSRRFQISTGTKTDDSGGFEFRVGPGTYELTLRTGGRIIPGTPQVTFNVGEEREIVKEIQLP